MTCGKIAAIIRDFLDRKLRKKTSRTTTTQER